MVDVFEAVELLRKEYPEDFQSLTEIPGTYKTIDFNSEKPMYFEVQKCHIVLNYFGKVSTLHCAKNAINQFFSFSLDQKLKLCLHQIDLSIMLPFSSIGIQNLISLLTLVIS